MVYTEPNLIHIEEGSELARLLDDMGDTPLLLEKDGMLYRVSRQLYDIWAGYDANRAKAAIMKTAGSWSDIDTVAFIADIYRAREEGSRAADRP